MIQDFHPDIIVDWGGSSYKVFMDGKRIGTEALDMVWSAQSQVKITQMLLVGHGCECISL